MEEQVKFDQVIHCGCGMDVHKKTVVATIRRSDTDFETREFNTYTRSLKSLREWCKSEGVTHIAMESTGIYWKPVYNIMEEDFEVILVNARHIKNVPGHKTDKKDSRWISKLLLSGLLKGSFIPPREIRELRDLVRYKRKVVGEISSDKNRIIKMLEDCNLKLSSVFSNVSGASASKIIDDIIEGHDDVEGFLQHIHGKVQAPKNEIRQALEGTLTDHHRTMLRVIKMSIEGKERIVEALDKQIDACVKKYAIEIEQLQSIPGVGKESAIRIISEIGVDMSRFPNENHLSSWAGMSPGNNESAGKKKAQE